MYTRLPAVPSVVGAGVEAVGRHGDVVHRVLRAEAYAYIYIYIYIHIYIYPSIHLSIYLSLSLSIYIYISYIYRDI